jgi:RsiW-degrading membrane proteinase PrsW (M82 family)
MMYIILLLALATAPSFAIILYVYFRDKYEKEPIHLLVKCFLFGILSIIPAILIELAPGFSDESIATDIFITIVYAFLFVGLGEEFSKFFFIRVYIFRKKDFNEPFDGIIYSVMVSMGFATAENIFYVIEGGLSTGLLRMFSAVPAHAAFAIIMGYFIGLAKFRNNRFLYLLTGLLLAALAHGAYDFFLFQQNIPGLAVLSIVVLALIITLSFRAIVVHRRNSPFKPGQTNL